MSDKAIILISGWTGTETVLGPLALQFSHAGFDVIRTNLGKGFQRIQDSAESIASVINTFYPCYKHITVIGHSMGGLVARYGLTRGLFKADAYVSIATPHQGCVLAPLAAWSPSALQMAPNSKFIRHLGIPSIPSLALQAAWEEFVWPRSSTKITWGENITIPKVDHIMIARSQRTFYEIWSWLSDNFFPHEFFMSSPAGVELLIPYELNTDFPNCG